jgi:predicted nucleotide-binding protein with TIR-like domain
MPKDMKPGTDAAATRTYLSQADVPGVSLQRAIRIPSTIGDNYGYKASSPLQVAKALEVQPSSGGFRMLTGAAIAYGLTLGGYNADAISITPLGLRIVRPTSEGDDIAAKREALLRPRVIREFLTKYDSAPIPKDNIAHNVLAELGVPPGRTADVLRLILDGAESVGFLQNIKDRKYVELAGTAMPAEQLDEAAAEDTLDQEHESNRSVPAGSPVIASSRRPSSVNVPVDSRSKRVFITHGKNKALIEPIRKLLGFGEMEAIVSIQTQTVSQPVPGKVMEEMRGCGAAIIHVEDERHLTDKDGNEHIVLNDNVLIEIGAAMALFGQRFILVVKDGVKLPSNLQGLLVLSYKGDTLNMEETVRLLEAINDMKKRPLP